MFNYCKIKNIDTEDHSIMGTIISTDEEYIIQDSLRLAIANKDSILEKIATGKLQVGDSTEYIVSISDQLNYLKDITNVEIDEEGRQVNRIAAGKKGWVYMSHFFELETSKLDSLMCDDWQGNSDTTFSIKFYDSSDDEIVDSGTYGSIQEHLDNECIKTEVLFKPSYDYELISGSIRMEVKSSEDCRIWVVGGAVELGVMGVKEFARNMNLKYLGADEIIETDGRASKYMKKDTDGVPYQTNQIKFIIKHSVGYKFKIMPTLEYFRG